jgi:hypothetical protein
MGKNKKIFVKIMMALSVVALILAAVATLFKYNAINLAGTQWILISIVLAVYATYLDGCDCDCCDDKKEG